METKKHPGGYCESDSRFELEFWEKHGGVANFDLHLKSYRRCFPFQNLNFSEESILDIGSGAVSVFEKIAPSDSQIVPFDILAEEYNRIAPEKNFQVVSDLPNLKKFSLITVFNMIDHVVNPDEILNFAAERLQKNGKVWLAVHLHQPHGPKGHPQDFNSRTIVDLVSQHFQIENCGVIREGIPQPYLWWGQLALKEGERSSYKYRFFQAKTQVAVWKLQMVRAIVKLTKLMGMKKWLPPDWRY